MPGFAGDIYDGALYASTLALAIIGSQWINRQAERMFPQASVGFPNVLLKLATATAVIWGSKQVLRNPALKNVALAGAAYPLFTDALVQFAPGIATQVPSIGVATSPMVAVPAQGGVGVGAEFLGAGMDEGPLSELSAELEQDSDMSMY